MLSNQDIEIERLKSDLINMREERDILQAIVDNFNKTIAGVPALARAERLQSENARLTALLAAPAEDVREVVKETLYDKGWRLAKEGHGLSNLWGNCSDDSEMDEVYRGMKAYWNSVK